MSKLKWRKVSGQDEWRASHKLGRFIIYGNKWDGVNYYEAHYHPKRKTDDWDLWRRLVFDGDEYRFELRTMELAKQRCEDFIHKAKVPQLVDKLITLNERMDKLNEEYEAALKSNGYTGDAREQKINDKYYAKKAKLQEKIDDLSGELHYVSEFFGDEEIAILDKLVEEAGPDTSQLEARREELVKELIEIDKQLVEVQG